MGAQDMGLVGQTLQLPHANAIHTSMAPTAPFVRILAGAFLD